MYTVDEHDSVVPLQGLPKSCAGVPLPLVVADEHHVLVAYRMPVIDPEFDGTNPRSVGPSMQEPYAIVGFRSSVHMFGYPNDEALGGHPLYERGLGFYGAFEVLNSSWIRQIRAMNEVCFPGRSWHFDTERHFALTFHDSMFECIATGYEVRGEVVGTRREVMAHMNDLLHASE